MSIRVTFADGSVVEYPDAVGILGGPEGVSRSLVAADNTVIAVLDSVDVKEIEVVPVPV